MKTISLVLRYYRLGDTTIFSRLGSVPGNLSKPNYLRPKFEDVLLQFFKNTYTQNKCKLLDIVFTTKLQD